MRVDHRASLHERRPIFARAFAGHDRAEEGRLKRQHPIAIAGGAFGEEHNRIAGCEPRHDLVRGIAGRLAALAIDKNGPLQARQRRHERPTANFFFGHKRDRRDGRKHRNIQPRRVIAHQQHRLIRRQLAFNGKRHTQQFANLAVIPMGKAPRRVAIDAQENRLHRHQGDGQHEKSRKNRCSPERPHVRSYALSRLARR